MYKNSQDRISVMERSVVQRENNKQAGNYSPEQEVQWQEATLSGVENTGWEWVWVPVGKKWKRIFQKEQEHRFLQQRELVRTQTKSQGCSSRRPPWAERTVDPVARELPVLPGRSGSSLTERKNGYAWNLSSLETQCLLVTPFPVRSPLLCHGPRS